MTDHEPYVKVRATGRSSFFLKSPEYELSLMRWLIPPAGTAENGGYVTWTVTHAYGEDAAQKVAEKLISWANSEWNGKRKEWVVK